MIKISNAIIIIKIIACQQEERIKTKDFPLGCILWELRKRKIVEGIIDYGVNGPTVRYGDIWSAKFILQEFIACLTIREDKYFLILEEDKAIAIEELKNRKVPNEELLTIENVVGEIMNYSEEEMERYWGREHLLTIRTVQEEKRLELEKLKQEKKSLEI